MTRRLTFAEWQQTRQAMAAAGFTGSVHDWVQPFRRFSRSVTTSAQHMSTKVRHMAACLTEIMPINNQNREAMNTMTSIQGLQKAFNESALDALFKLIGKKGVLRVKVTHHYRADLIKNQNTDKG